jgi:hypothetical protein
VTQASSPLQAALGKRACDEVEAPRLSLATALPLSVWQDHLTPCLSVVAAARLRDVCKALRGVVDECPIKLGRVMGGWRVKAALTCFPAAQSMDLVLNEKEVRAADGGEWVELLRRHGGTLKRVAASGKRGEQRLDSAV